MSGGTISGTGYVVPILFAAGENRVVSNVLGHNQRPVVPGVQDTDSRPRAFRRAGGCHRSLDGRQNSYSYVTMGTATGFGGEAMGLKPL
jgi:hypothetical protein